MRLPATHLGVKMRKPILVVGACALLGGCALPIPIQVASWAIDVISVVATEKSVTDHGISALTNRDCALHRALTEDDNTICRETDGRTDVMVADAGKKGEALGKAQSPQAAPRFEAVEAQVAQAAIRENNENVSALASFETASGDEKPVVVKVDLAALQPVAEDVDRPFVHFSKAKPHTPSQAPQAAAIVEPEQVAVALPQKPGNAALSNKPSAGVYYVIGSFRSNERAKRHMQTFRQLVPSVLQGKIGQEGREVFRVVVGPFEADQRSGAYRRIKRAGIPDTWAIRVSPKDWSVAAQIRPTQQADAGAVLGARDWPGLIQFVAAR